MNTKHRARSLAARALLALLLQAGRRAHADAEAECELDIPPGPMNTTLLAIAHSCGAVLSLRPEVLAGRAAPAVRGRMTVRQALLAATHASGLRVEVSAAGHWAVVPAADTAHAQPGPATTAQPPGVAQATPPAAAGGLPRVVVTGNAPATGLKASRAWAATRSDVPLAEMPQAVSVLTGDALELQGGRNIMDAASFVPGMVASTVVSGSVEDFGGTGLSGPSLTIRGLPAALALSGQRLLRDTPAPDTALLDRVEVPRGPSGVVDGMADWKGRGGLVNLVPRLPGKGTHGSLSQTVSSRDSGTLRLAGDAGRPWSDSAAWRLSGYAQQSGQTAGGFERSSGAGFMGSSEVRTERFNALLTLYAERRREAPPPAARGGRALVDGVIVEGPAERRARDPEDPADRHLFTSSAALLTLGWAISPRWRLNIRSAAQGLTSDLQRHQPLTPPLDRSLRSGGG